MPLNWFRIVLLMKIEDVVSFIDGSLCGNKTCLNRTPTCSQEIEFACLPNYIRASILTKDQRTQAFEMIANISRDPVTAMFLLKILVS